jgi:sterol desaturase/sphingolipid hydroxylase (fatty acid hydroxylase superfamily)
MVPAVEIALAALGAFVFGTFVEYVVHRAMHWGLLYPEGHRYHHRTGDARTFLKDFMDYGMGAVIGCWFGFLISVPCGIGWALGGLVYAALASYAHQIQHADADLVFWMKRPVHRVHHDLDMTDGNFGVLVDWWDRLFGTYKPVEWPRAAVPGYRLSRFLAIPWR